MPAFIIKDSWLLWGVKRAARYASRTGSSSGGLSFGNTGSRAAFTLGFSTVELTIYKGVLNQYTNSPEGTVGKWLHRQGYKIVVGAKAQVGVQTGRLRNSIYMTHSRDPLGQRLEIGSKLPYALVHHEGSRPHLIRSNNPGGLLRFGAGTRIIQTRVVRHPGFKANRYLKDNIKLIEGIQA
jgi:hypothetical protein